MEQAILWIFCYLLGSLPFGVLVARFQNIDLREHGSGNIGATNVTRVLGKKAGVITLVGDVLKGSLAVTAAAAFFEDALVIALAGLFAFLGHLYSVFLKFKGGKGVATGLGIFLYMMPVATFLSVVVVAVALRTSGYVALGSIAASLALPFFGLLLKMPPAYIGVSGFVALMVLYKHRDNIGRILNGTEHSFTKKNRI